MIDVQSLTKLYGDFPAVRDLAFAVRPGEVVGLVGPNGAGKTTTLRCLAGLPIPTAGRTGPAGHDPAAAPDAATPPAAARAARPRRPLAAEPVAAKQVLAFIPDEPHLFEYLTVEEHLRFV